MKFGSYDPMETESRYASSFFTPENTKESFKSAYRLFEEFASYQALTRPSNQPTAVPKKIIDLGCATGEFLSYVRYRSPQLRLVGLDASERFIDAARKTFASDDRSTFVRADIFQAPECLVDTFDGVFCLGTLSVFEDFRPAVDTMISLLSSKGVAILEGYFCPLDFEVDVVWRNTSDIHSSGPPGGLVMKVGVGASNASQRIQLLITYTKKAVLSNFLNLIFAWIYLR